ncbi:Uncharacterised protein [Vibrio cholerae]|nr:Uncharacterised protein [Vibrio cholerae]
MPEFGDLDRSQKQECFSQGKRVWLQSHKYMALGRLGHWIETHRLD